VFNRVAEKVSGVAEKVKSFLGQGVLTKIEISTGARSELQPDA
jgi:hypothetical protein